MENQCVSQSRCRSPKTHLTCPRFSYLYIWRRKKVVWRKKSWKLLNILEARDCCGLPRWRLTLSWAAGRFFAKHPQTLPSSSSWIPHNCHHHRLNFCTGTDSMTKSATAGDWSLAQQTQKNGREICPFYNANDSTTSSCILTFERKHWPAFLRNDPVCASNLKKQINRKSLLFLELLQSF